MKEAERLRLLRFFVQKFDVVLKRIGYDGSGQREKSLQRRWRDGAAESYAEAGGFCA